MMTNNATTPTTPLQMLTAATATTSPTPILFTKGQTQQVTIVLQSTGTTSAGTIQIEEAYYPENTVSYSGTWSPLGSTIAASSFTGGAQQIIHIVGYSCWAVRVRVATTITGGGTIDAWGWGN